MAGQTACWFIMEQTPEGRWVDGGPPTGDSRSGHPHGLRGAQTREQAARTLGERRRAHPDKVWVAIAIPGRDEA